MAVIKIFDTLIFGRTQAQTQERVIAFILNCVFLTLWMILLGPNSHS